MPNLASDNFSHGKMGADVKWMLKRKVEEQNLHAKRIMACPCAYSDGTSRCSDLERAKGSMARKCRCTWPISQTSKWTGTGKESLT